MFLFAGELHPHRCPHGAGQQGGIGGHIVGTVAAIATGRFHANHIDGGVGQAHEPGQVGAQHVRVLRARPNDEARLVWICRIGCLSLPLRHGTRRTYGAVQLVGPHIGARQTLRRLGQCSVHIALVHQPALGGWVVAQGLLNIAEFRQSGPVFPLHAQLAHGLLGLFFALGNHPHKITDHDHRTHTGDVRDGRLVHRRQRVADEVTMVSPGIRGPHHTPVQHAGHTHVVHKHLLTADLGGNVHPLHALADEAVLAGRLQRGRQRQSQRDVLCLQQLAIGAVP